MTSRLVSVKVPVELFQSLPAAHSGRSQFIVAALREKISREQPRWQPSTRRGARLAALLKKGAKERLPLLDQEGIAQELRTRRGSFH